MRGGAHGLHRFGQIVRNAFVHESLDIEPEAPPRARRARSLARALFAIEELPEDPQPPAHPSRRDRLRALAASEELPLDPEAPPRASRGPGVLRALLVPEQLPEDPVEPSRPARHRWLSWLFRPESLDPP